MLDSQTPKSQTVKPKPVILCILDGWGDRSVEEGNAILKGTTPTWDRIKTNYPCAQLQASATDVGLPQGQMGNSEVGHMNLGAGRVVIQDLPRIDESIANGSINNRAPLKELITALKASSGVCHMMGLVSPGGVHSHQDHLTALAKILDSNDITICLHAFLDGRDTPPCSAKEFIGRVLSETNKLNRFSIATMASTKVNAVCLPLSFLIFFTILLCGTHLLLGQIRPEQ